MKTFAQNLASLMPNGITLPIELVEAFGWLEDQGWHNIRGAGAPEDHWLSIYPSDLLNHPVSCHVIFGGTSLPYTDHWATPDPTIDARIAEIGETSGDGGRVAIWLDEAGNQQFVHIGHSSLGVITDDPLILLQFFAMGYPEPGTLERTDITPVQAILDTHGIADLEALGPNDQPIIPEAFQTFLKQRFGVDIPTAARDLGITNFAQYHDSDTTDPFARWIATASPEPSEAELAYGLELMRTVEALDIKDTDSTDVIMGKIGSLFQSKD
ncbi:hypothetical protein [Sulfitobacter sp.]|uniref:hypothetical protein n=1 Tax=Sulfitobacter sp. TaxID=1903071 RepID=UPI003002B6BC